MQDALLDLLAKRRDRAIGVVLRVKEREVDAQLSATQSHKLRKVILDQFNEFHDLVVDVLGSVDDGEAVLNEEYLAKLDQMHQRVIDIQRRIATG
jgi:hypothetical protein